MKWGRDSAGAPPTPGGEVEYSFPFGEVKRIATYTCRHCGLPFPVPTGMLLEDVSWKCACCWGLVCPRCAQKGTCSTAQGGIGEFMRQVEEAEARHRFRVAAGLVE